VRDRGRDRQQQKGERRAQEGETAAAEPLSIPKLPVPASQRAYANVIHWVTLVVSIAALFVPIFVLANPANNVLNPNTIFGAIFNGASPGEIWATSGTGGFPGTHFYLQNILKADSWAMLVVNIGCAVGLFAVVPAVLIQFFKEKDRVSACLGTVMAVLIVCAMTGCFNRNGENGYADLIEVLRQHDSKRLSGAWPVSSQSNCAYSFVQIMSAIFCAARTDSSSPFAGALFCLRRPPKTRISSCLDSRPGSCR
jgi:hypothetical protein